MYEEFGLDDIPGLRQRQTLWKEVEALNRDE